VRYCGRYILRRSWRSFSSTAQEIDGGEAMLVLVEQEM